MASSEPNELPDSVVYPFERQLAYVGGWVVLGGLAGFVAWAIAQYSRGNESDLDVGKWIGVGGGLAGAASLTWVVSLTVLP